MTLSSLTQLECKKIITALMGNRIYYNDYQDVTIEKRIDKLLN